MQDASPTVIPAHPAADLFPSMSDEEFRELVSDIREHGLREPIWLYAGQVLDGRNRLRACNHLGIAPAFREFDGPSPASFVVSMNLHRRHLTSSQRAAVAVALLPALEEEALSRKAAAGASAAPGRPAEKDVEIFPHLSEGRAREQAAAILNTNPRYVSDAKRLQEEAPELFEEVRSGKVTIPEARRELAREERLARKQEDAAAAIAVSGVPLSSRCSLLVSPVAELAEQVALGSVDVIITDPPYGERWLPVYEDLAAFAAHALKPGGSLLCMTGQMALPGVFSALARHLSYHWTLAYLTPGGQSPQIFPRKVNTFWKPVLWFTNGPAAAGDWHGDVIRSDVNDNDKSFHEWGQSESGTARLVDGWSRPGEVVCDPFVGGGTTADVCLRMGRRFVGADASETAIATTRERIGQ